MENNDTVLVNDEMRNDDKNLKELYYKLGKAYYEERFEDPLPELLPLFDQITKIKRTALIPAGNRTKKICSGCGNELPMNAAFCSRCGRKVEE